ncbi:R-spondin-3-like [Stegastes partitus]|uniref:R-spondin-3-like n=1 Tax=Stegastes partitus TaxID=144197 RepID=A0A3B5BBU2_9TELE|nr:PREDICTED: R-spondin-3-like [Stegastes partitus]
MRVPSFVWILQLVNLTEARDANVLQLGRSSSVSSVCQAGCATCSAPNGCLTCKSRFFFHLELDGIRQRGTCLTSCPRGHYGRRSPHTSTCTKCKADCASCFSEGFCTRCHPGHFLLRGRCESSCPDGLTENTALRECTECSAGCELCTRRNVCTRCREDLFFLHHQCHLSCPRGFQADVQLMQCTPESHCEVGEWTRWGPCVGKRRMRGFRRGEQTRTRQAPLSPLSVSGDPCPHVTEIRKCVLKKRRSRRL